MRPARVVLVLATVLATLLPATPARAAIGLDAVATGLDQPAAFTVAEDGRIFYGERFSGEVRILQADGSGNTLFWDFANVVSDGERGLLGLALHPDYPATPHLFAFVTQMVGGQVRSRIMRLTDSGGVGTAPKAIFSTAASSGYHVGGRILFGPGGKLFAVVGEGHNSANSQNLADPHGKMLRMNASGTAVSTNPFGNRIWAFGIRNSFGFAFDPQTGRLWQTEAGPQCNDELNRIPIGANMAWGPNWTCSGTAPQNTNNSGPAPRTLPKRFYNPTSTPVGIAFCELCGLGSINDGKLLFAMYETGEIRRVTLGPNRLSVVSQTVVYDHPSPLYSMEVGPDTTLYVSDGDTIYRLELA